MSKDRASRSERISKSFDLSGKPALARDIEFVAHRGRMVLMDFVTGRVLLLSDIGQHIISLCRGKHTVGEIAEQAAVFNNEIRPNEILALINYLRTNQLLRELDIAIS